jgi:uncharacterized membrane protein YdjX (TVP38/TMEM64 family)
MLRPMPLAPRFSPKRILIALGATAVFFALVWWLREQLGLDLAPQSLRPWVQSFGSYGPLVFVTLTAGRMLLGIPSQLLMIVGGLCFGTLLGALYGGIGLTTSAIATFLASRWAGREAVERRVPEKLRPIFDRAGTRLGALFIFLGTAYPVGFITAYNALAGITQMTLARFTLAAAAGSLVRATLYAYFGNSLMSGDILPLVYASVLIALAAALPLAFPRSRRWVRELLMR